jgi:hypothetical protein
MDTTQTNTDARSQGKWAGMNWIRKDLRLAVYLRDGMACMWCGATLEEGVQLTLDHVIPHSHGGDNAVSNLVCSCQKCNSSRGNRAAVAFAKATAGYVNHGVTAKAILSAITHHVALDIKPFRTEAKTILSRRPSWQAALETASTQ